MANLRILVVGNYNITPRREWFLADQYVLMQGLIKLGHFVMPFGDRQYARDHGWIRGHRFGGKKASNHALIELAKDFKPDMLLFIHADMITAHSLRIIKDYLPQCKMIQWNGDGAWLENNIQKILHHAEIMDMSFITSAGALLTQLQQQNPNIAFVPNMVDIGLQRYCNDDYPRHELTHDLFCALGNGGDQRDFADFIGNGDRFAHQTQQHSPQQMRLFFAGALGNDNVMGINYDDCLSSSAMGINLSRHGGYYLYSSNRMAHLIGNGILTFIDAHNGFEDLLSDDEVVFIKNMQDFYDNLNIYYDDDGKRQKIAKNGREAYHRYFSSQKIADYMIKTMMGEYDPKVNYWVNIR